MRNLPLTTGTPRLKSPGVAFLLMLLGGLLLWLGGSPATSHAGEEIRSVHIRNTQVQPDGTLKLFVSFRSGHDTGVPLTELDDLIIKIDDERVQGNVTAKPFFFSNEGTAVFLGMDTSGSMRRAFPKLVKAVTEHVQEMRKGVDYMAVGAIDDSFIVHQDFTSDPDIVVRTLNKLSARSQTTALFESIYLGVERLAKRGQELPARRFMIVVTDGYNEKKGWTANDCIEIARKESMQVHSLIYLASRATVYLEAKGELQKISLDSGGATMTTSDVDEIGVALRRLREDLATEWVLTIPGQNLPADGRTHEVTLHYDRVFTTGEYVAPYVEGAHAQASTGGTGAPPPPAAPAPESAPAASSGGDTLPPWLVILLIVLAVGVVALGIWLGVRHNQRKAEELQKARDEARRIEMENQQKEIQRLEEEKLEALAAAAAAQKAGAEPAPVPQPAAPDYPPHGQSPYDSPGGGGFYGQIDVPTGPRKASKTMYIPPPGGSAIRKTQYVGSGEESSLQVVSGLTGLDVVPIPSTLAPFTVGYDMGNTISLNADSVSGTHAELRRIPSLAPGEQETLEIRDLGSTNGTYVDEQRVGSDFVPVHQNSIIRLGVVELRYVSNG